MMNTLQKIVAAVFLSSLLFIGSSAEASAQRWYGHVYMSETTDGNRFFDPEILGVRALAIDYERIDVTTAWQQGNVSHWVLLNDGDNANDINDWVEVGYKAWCNRSGGCSEPELPPLREFFMYEHGENAAGEAEGTWVYKSARDGESEPEVDYGDDIQIVMLARDEVGEEWWGGISSGGQWVATRNFGLVHPEKAHIVDIGSEITDDTAGLSPAVIIPPVDIEWLEYTEDAWWDHEWDAWLASDGPHEDNPPEWEWVTEPESGCTSANSPTSC